MEFHVSLVFLSSWN